MPTRSGRVHTAPAAAPHTAPAAAPAPAPPPAPPTNMGGLSAYEIQRLENIRRNEEVLMSLNLTSLSSQFSGGSSTAARPSQRGVAVSRKRSSSTPAAATRTSARTKNIAPDCELKPSPTPSAAPDPTSRNYHVYARFRSTQTRASKWSTPTAASS